MLKLVSYKLFSTEYLAFLGFLLFSQAKHTFCLLHFTSLAIKEMETHVILEQNQLTLLAIQLLSKVNKFFQEHSFYN